MMRYAPIILTVSMVLAGCGPSNKLTNEQKKQAIDTMAAESLERLYSEKVAAREEVEKAAGYGAFSNANINIIFASAGGGYGVVVDNETGAKTYMRMGMGGLGFGLGVKDFRQVLIFDTKDTRNIAAQQGRACGRAGHYYRAGGISAGRVWHQA